MRELHDLATPAAIVDLDRLERNCADMIDRADRLGVRLRPHAKTHKCLEAARLQVGAGPRRLTVSTLAEAAFFARAGFEDLTWAVPVSPVRIEQAVALAESIGGLHVLVDHEDARAMLARAAGARGVRVPVFLKVDCGYHRAGVDPERTASIDLVRRIVDSPALAWAGILTHAGQAYGGRNREDLVRVAEHERDVMVAFAQRLRADGLDVPCVSVGSTPTMRVGGDLTGVDEIRPGNYAFLDVFQATIGACALDEVAFSVLASVIGTYPERLGLVLDSGATALSHDPGATHVDPACGFGVLCDVDGRPLPDGTRIAALSQEHGKVRSPASSTRSWRIGDRVRVLPNHACMAAGLFDRYHVVRGREIVDVWHPVRQWSPEPGIGSGGSAFGR